MSKENPNYSNTFLNSLTKYNADQKTLDDLAEQYPMITGIADKKELNESAKALREMKKEYDVIKRTFKANADTIRNTGNSFISKLEIDFRELTFKIKDRIKKYKEAIDTYKKEQANILGNINTLQGIGLLNQTVLGDEQVHEESMDMFTIDKMKSDTEIIDFMCDIIKKTNMKLVAKANDFKGIQIYHSNEPGASMDPRIALSIMIENYQNQ